MLLVPSSAYILGPHAPGLEYEKDENAIIVKISKGRILQRLVAAGSFYGSIREQYDTFMVTERILTENRIESTINWFARVRLPSIVVILSNFVSSPSSSDSPDFPLEETGSENEVCSVQ